MRDNRYGLLAAALSLLAPLLSGCQSDEIETYTVHRTLNRVLVALVPVHDHVYYFKLVGPRKSVGEEETAFRDFLATVRQPEQKDGQPTWNAPASWQQDPPIPGREASFQISRPEGDLELTITRFPATAATTLDQVNRWRDQLDLGKIAEDELVGVSAPIEVGGAKATFVDMTGPGSGRTRVRVPTGTRAQATPRPMAPAAETAGSKSKLKFTKPDGWVELPVTGMRAAAFRIEDGQRQAEVTVIPLGARSGSLLDNVNRWRTDDLKLSKIGADELDRHARRFDAGGPDTRLVELLGPDGEDRLAVLGVILPRDGVTWFFKMKGPADLVGKQKAAFEAFVKSVQF